MPTGLEPLEPRLLLSFTEVAGQVPGTDTSVPIWIDYNDDGLTDAFVGGNLLRNDGAGQFTSVGQINNGAGQHLIADFDNDGFQDIITSRGGAEVEIIRNDNGTGAFIPGGGIDGLSGTATEGFTVGDYNDDGYVDVYVGGYEGPGINYPDQLFVNVPDATKSGGRGLQLAWTESGTILPTRGVTSADFNEDGHLDVYASHYRLETNTLWVNNASGSSFPFTNGTATTGTSGGNGHSIGSAWGDLDSDGHIDLLAGNFAHASQPETQVLLNQGPNDNFEFTNLGQRGIYYVEAYASPALADFDNDGRLDLFFSALFPDPYGDNSVLFRNTGAVGSPQFADVTGPQGLPTSGWGEYDASWADYDNDGDLDLFAHGRHFRNDQTSGNSWMKVDLRGNGTTVDTTAIGAQVRIAAAGGRTITRQVEAGTGTGNQSELMLHFGLGATTGDVTIDIFWPDGSTQSTTATLNQTIRITQGVDPGPGGDPKSDKIDFGVVDLQLYGGGAQTTNGTAIAANGGTTLHLQGNTWRTIDLEYTITPDTVLEFEFEGVVQGEVHAIGFDTDQDLGSPLSFQLYGAQTFENQDFRDYIAADGVKHYAIPVGQYFTGDVNFLFFANDHDTLFADGEANWTNVRVHEGNLPTPGGGPVNFNLATLEDFGNQTDPSGTAIVEDNGATLRLSGNIWQRMDFAYTVTADTVLEFDFSSPVPGEVHSIGLDTDTALEGPGSFQLYGTQTWQVQDFRDYAAAAPGSKHYAIPIGQYLTGDVQIMFFGNDDDQLPQDAESIFSNVIVHEGDLANPNPGPALIDFRNHTVSGYGGAQQTTNGTATVVDDGNGLNLSGNGWQKIDFAYTILPDTVLEFEFESSTQGEVHAIGLDADNGAGSAASFQLYGTQTAWVQDFRDYASAAPGKKSYSIPVGQYLTGAVQYLTFVNDHDGLPSDAVGTYSDIVLYEPEPLPPDVVDFTGVTVGNYGGAAQTTNGQATVEQGGQRLRLTGNTWKQIDFSYNVTPDTVLEFDYASGSQGEIQGIGFDDDLGLDSARFFSLYGVHNWGHSDFDTYLGSGAGSGTGSGTGTGSLQHFSIPLGQFFTGAVNHLVFANDDDVTDSTAESLFCSVRIFEDNNFLSLDAFTVDEDSSTTNFDVLANDNLTGLSITAVTQGSRGGTVAIAGGGLSVDYTPAANFFGDETFTYSAQTANPGESGIATVSVDVTPTNDAPDAVDDAFTFTQSPGAFSLNVLANDDDAPDSGETLTIINVSQGTLGGTVAIAAGGSSIDYTPASVGTETFTYGIGDGTPGSEDTAIVQVTIEAVSLDLNAYPIFSYGGLQDLGGSAVVTNGGSTLAMLGNTWKAIAFDHTITPNTVLELDFSSSAEGEVHTIGFDVDLAYNVAFSFQFHGTQTAGVQDFNDYVPPTTKHYVIPVGQYQTGDYGYILFGNDHDVFGPTGQGSFGNLQIYEALPSPLALSDHAILGDGTARSRVTEVMLTFNHEIMQLDAAAVAVVPAGGASMPIDVEDTGDGTTYRVSFNGAGYEHGSLPDGQYTLTVDGSQVQDIYGQPIDGPDPVIQFHRLYGDVDGDDDVDATDQTAFLAAFGTQIGDAGYDTQFDFDGDERINAVDKIEFYARMGQTSADAPPPVINDPSVVVNDGHRQRSRVTNIAVGFDVTVNDPTAALTLVRTDGPGGNVALTVQPGADASTYDLTFNGAGADGYGSLVDGVYQLRIDMALVSDSATGQPLGAGVVTHDLHRLFGDIDGNGVMASVDMMFMFTSFGRSSADAHYVAALDEDDNGVIDIFDLLKLRDRLGTALSI